MGTIPPTRTHRTALSDPELLILDFLFDKNGATVQMLSRDEYQFHMNCLYDHGLSDDALRATTRKLMKLGVLAELFNSENGRRGFMLTENGGHVWEEERQPDWDCYESRRTWWQTLNELISKKA